MDPFSLLDLYSKGDLPCAEAAGYPSMWVWSLWIAGVAAITVATVECIKAYAGIKQWRVWRIQRNAVGKVGVLLPFLAPVGGGLGWYAFSRAGMMETQGLCVLLGVGVAILSAPLYDATVGVIELIPRIVRKRFGVDTTIVPTLDDDLPADGEDHYIGADR
jgi:hypothetical protein